MTRRPWRAASWRTCRCWPGEPVTDGGAIRRPGERRRGSPWPQMSFEEALAELEGIVQKLERGQLDLESSIQAYERGTALRAALRREAAPGAAAGREADPRPRGQPEAAAVRGAVSAPRFARRRWRPWRPRSRPSSTGLLPRGRRAAGAGCTRPCAMPCSAAASACGRSWSRPRPSCSACAGARADPGRRRDRADPRLLPGPRRPAGHGRRGAAPRPAVLPSRLRRGHRDPGRRRAAAAGVRGAGAAGLRRRRRRSAATLVAGPGAWPPARSACAAASCST